MNFVNFEDLEGDVPPSRSVPPGIEFGSLLQDDQALASAKCRTAGYGFFHETERIGIEAAMRFEVADRKTDSNLIYSFMAQRYQTDSISIGIRETLGFCSVLTRNDQFSVAATPNIILASSTRVNDAQV
jgi:hypothetical protein